MRVEALMHAGDAPAGVADTPMPDVIHEIPASASA